MKKKNKKWIWMGIGIVILLTLLLIFNSNLPKSIVSEKITCSSNSDCFDGNIHISPLCVNSGQVNSYCFHGKS